MVGDEFYMVPRGRLPKIVQITEEFIKVKQDPGITRITYKNVIYRFPLAGNITLDTYYKGTEIVPAGPNQTLYDFQYDTLDVFSIIKGSKPRARKM